MRRQIGSIRVRIVAVVVVFTLASTLASAILSLRHFQRSARESLLRSAEFNLNLVAGLVSRDMEALTSLRDWCGADGGISGYISGSASGADTAVRAFEAMSGQVLLNRAYPYLLRMVAVSQDYQRILQCGSGTTAGVPLTPYSINRLERLERGLDGGQWAGVATDPFTTAGGPRILYICAPICQGSGRSRPAVGTVFLLVSSAVVTDPIAGYQLPEGCELLLTVGERSFALDGALTAVSPPASCAPAPDGTFNDSTRVSQFAGADGSRFLSVSCPVGGSGMWLTQTISPQALNASLHSLYGSQLLLLCLSSFLIGAAVLWMLGRTINRPILRLQSRMEAISQGDFSADPSIEWDNELGDVGRGINGLSRSVSSLMEKRIEDEKQQLDLEYRMLQNQISPHFIYNTLNSIKWMASIQHAPGVAEMVTALSRLLKSVSKGTQKLVPLKEEFALLEDYFTIQRYRYGGTISLDTPELDGAGWERYLIPRFTLQPLAENAIFHGIEPKGGVGRLWTAIRRDPDSGDLLISMSDDGVGMEEEQIRRLLSGDGQDGGEAEPFRHVGLWSVHRLLQLSFGPDYGLTVRSAPGQGTTVTLRLPEQP